MRINRFESASEALSYDIVTVQNAASADERLFAHIRGKRILVLTDDNVAPLYLNGFLSRIAGVCSAESLILPAGESTKNLDTFRAVISSLSEKGFTRRDMLLGLGGGVVSDICGFAASCYMRGIGYINVPTTLLSMTDSAIGGKTGVDLGGIKNVVGSFYQPGLVICALDYLRTLPQREYRSGLGEIAKYALISGEERFPSGISATDIDEETVSRCIGIKLDHVMGDIRDNGKRRILNLGHTFGHAFEAESGFSLSHGEAVSLGLACECALGEMLGYTETGVADRVAGFVSSLGLPCDYAPYLEGAAALIAHDKKSDGASIEMPFVQVPGCIRLESVPLEAFDCFLRS